MDLRDEIEADLMALREKDPDPDQVKKAISDTLYRVSMEGYIFPEPEITVDGTVVNVTIPLAPILGPNNG